MRREEASVISPQDECLLCTRGVQPSDFPRIIQNALDRKYCANINGYYFVRSVARILENERFGNKVHREFPLQRVVQLLRRGLL